MRRNRENRGLMSRLPENDAYWEALTDRLVTDAAGWLSAYRRAGARWWHGLARFSAPLAGGAAAAVIAALLWLPALADDMTGTTSPAAVYGLAPDDPLAVLFVAYEDAPTMATLIATHTSERAP